MGGFHASMEAAHFLAIVPNPAATFVWSNQVQFKANRVV